MRGGIELPNAKRRTGTFLLELYSPHSGQKILHENQARFRIATCGRRWGKTLGVLNEFGKYGAENTKSVCWWVSPVYRQAAKPYRMFVDKFSPIIRTYNKSEMAIELVNGALMEFKSADNFDALRGEGVSFLVIDEAALVAREAWESALRPTLSDTMGRAIFISTPKGRNWFYEAWVRGQDPNHPDWASFKFPTSSNPYIHQSELESARNTLPRDVFHQEYEAEFLEDSAGVFRGIKAAIAGELTRPIIGHRYLFGWDPAKHRDYSVLVVIDIDEERVVHFARFNQVEYELQLDFIERIARDYNRARGLMDSTGVGDPLLEAAKRRGINVQGYQFTNASKSDLVQNLAVMIEQGAVKYPEIDVLLHELEFYQYEMTPSGKFVYGAPDGYHDDAVTALMLAAWLLKQVRKSRILTAGSRYCYNMFR